MDFLPFLFIFTNCCLVPLGSLFIGYVWGRGMLRSPIVPTETTQNAINDLYNE